MGLRLSLLAAGEACSTLPLLLSILGDKPSVLINGDQLMTDNRAPREKRQQPGNAGNEKKLYQKPAFRYERVFETLALSCGKIAPTQSTCHHNRKTS